MKRTVQQKFGKKLFLSIVAIAGLASFSAKAQSPTIYLGVTAGPQYTTIMSNDENFSGGVGYNGAITVEGRFSQKFGIELQGGLSALNATTKYKDSIIYYDYVQRFNNNYTFNTTWLQGRALFKYYIRLGGDPITPYDRPEGSGNYLFFEAGPYFGTILSGSSLTKIGRTGSQTTQKHINFTPDTAGTKTSTTYTDADVQEANDKKIITNVDYGFVLGAGISLKLSQSASLDFVLNYTGGLTSIDNPIMNASDQSANGFFLGHNTITFSSTGKTAGISYTPANATNAFIAFNIGLKFKLYGDSY